MQRSQREQFYQGKDKDNVLSPGLLNTVHLIPTRTSIWLVRMILTRFLIAEEQNIFIKCYDIYIINIQPVLTPNLFLSYVTSEVISHKWRGLPDVMWVTSIMQLMLHILRRVQKLQD